VSSKPFEQIACAGLRDTHLRGDCFRRRSEAILGRSCLRRLAFRRMLNSSKGQVSRNVARLDGPVTAPRIDTHYVATEFGVAILLFRSRPISEASGEGPVERNQNQRTAVRTALMCGPGSNSPLANSNSPSSQLQLYAKENFHE
jgi:hypothetical protein